MKNTALTHARGSYDHALKWSPTQIRNPSGPAFTPHYSEADTAGLWGACRGLAVPWPPGQQLSSGHVQDPPSPRGTCPTCGHFPGAHGAGRTLEVSNANAHQHSLWNKGTLKSTRTSLPPVTFSGKEPTQPGRTLQLWILPPQREGRVSRGLILWARRVLPPAPPDVPGIPAEYLHSTPMTWAVSGTATSLLFPFLARKSHIYQGYYPHNVFSIACIINNKRRQCTIRFFFPSVNLNTT